MIRRFEDDFENYVENLTEFSVTKRVRSTLFISLGKHV